MLKCVGAQPFQHVTVIAIHGPQVSLKVFVRHQVQQLMDHLFRGLLPNTFRNRAAMVLMVTEFVQDQAANDVASLRFLPQKRQGVDANPRLLEAGIAQLLARKHLDGEGPAGQFVRGLPAPGEGIGQGAEFPTPRTKQDKLPHGPLADLRIGGRRGEHRQGSRFLRPIVEFQQPLQQPRFRNNTSAGV